MSTADLAFVELKHEFAAHGTAQARRTIQQEQSVVVGVGENVCVESLACLLRPGCDGAKAD